MEARSSGDDEDDKRNTERLFYFAVEKRIGEERKIIRDIRKNMRREHILFEISAIFDAFRILF